MTSTLDELEEIERSARVGPPVGRVSPPRPAQQQQDDEDRRHGSSMFSGKGAVMDYNESLGKNGNSKGLLEDFPARYQEQQYNQHYQQPAPVKPPGGTAVKRGSVALKPMSGLGGLIDFDDSDFDDSDEEDLHELPGAPMPGSSDAVGGPNHRPLVGGFAAAAYEAARAHHYASLNKSKAAEVPKRRSPPPSI